MILVGVRIVLDENNNKNKTNKKNSQPQAAMTERFWKSEFLEIC